jgi:YgiT-type zinc finger domain-containing protein
MGSNEESGALRERLQQWRAQHPRATLREIEDAVEAELARLRAEVVGELATASPSADLTKLEEGQRPRCERCGTALVARGRHRRRLREAGGQLVELERSYGVCPTCGEGLFPPR